MEFFDSHSHYNDEKYDTDRNELIKAIYNEGITKTVCVGYNVEKSQEALKIAKENHFMFATCGISPNDIEEYVDNSLEKIEEIAKDGKIVAIGEIGLDYYWNKDNKEEQKELFIKQIEIANRVNKPIVIHTRDAAVDTIEILKEHPVNKKGIFHCCPLNQELIKEGLKLGFYISFSGNITFKNAKSEPCVSLVPLDKLLIETDCPYLSPEPYRGKRNDSRNVKLVAAKVAEIKGLSLEEVAKITYENANKIFEI
ncbi:MAG: TatD family hydrolase [Clostridia bacterium]|nr:TatD family hydrolase [Clostridia bacterium]